MDGSDSDQENISGNVRGTQQRKLCYGHLLDKIEGIQESEELGLQTVKDIGDILKEVNNLEVECDINERVEHADETLLDSMVLSSASSILVKCIQAVDVFTSSYEPADFAKGILKYIEADNEESEPHDFLKLLPDADRIIPEVPQYEFVYGAYDLSKIPEPKQRKQKQKRAKENFTKRRPEKVTNLEKEERAIDEIVKVLHDVLEEEYNNNDRRPVKYYDYVVDTESFASTIENMFYCSFLIRDGKAHIDLDGKGVPLIKPVAKKDLKRYRDDRGSNFQMISSITIPEWEKFKTEGFLQKRKRNGRK